MRSKRYLTVFLVAALAGAGVGAAWWATPLASGGGQPPTDGLGECEFARSQPPEPLKMNSVVIGDFAKTVVMEKEVFNCFRDEDLVQVRDLETFIEIIERKRRTDVTRVEKRVELAECVKNLESGTVRCATSDLELAPISSVPPLRGCVPADQDDPLDMNTVVLDDFAKTIKVEKEVFRCPPVRPNGPRVLADLYIFTEIVQRKVTIAPADVPFTTIRPVSKRFEGIICLKTETTVLPEVPRIIGCREFATESEPPPGTCPSRLGLTDRCIDLDGITTPNPGGASAQKVTPGAALRSWPTGGSTEGIDMFDNDGNAAWTFGPAGDDLHLEDPRGSCPTASRNGVHDLGQDCKVLDINASLVNGQPVSCDLETGAFCPPGLPDNVKFHDLNGDGFYDNAEDIILDVNGNGVFD